jgi:hypothetical protein
MTAPHITGFQTENGTLYWVDPQGSTHRYMRERHMRLCTLFDACACVYITSKLLNDVRLAERAGNRVSMVRLEGGTLHECSDPRVIRNAFAAGEEAGVGIMNTIVQSLAGGPGKQFPTLGYYPFEQGPAAPGYVVGGRIRRLYHDDAELVRDGFPVMHILKGRARGALPGPSPKI